MILSQPRLRFPIPTLFAFLLVFYAAPALALTAAEIDAGNRAAQQIQNSQQERQQQQLREDALRRGQATPQETPEVPVAKVPKSTICRDIKEIVLSGVTLLPEAEQKRLTAPYENRCLYAEDIEKLLADILKAYMGRSVPNRVRLCSRLFPFAHKM